MDHRVLVVLGGEWDVGLVERELSVPPLPIPPVLAPVLTIDGQVEPDASEAKHSARYGVARSTRSAASPKPTWLPESRVRSPQAVPRPAERPAERSAPFCAFGAVGVFAARTG